MSSITTTMTAQIPSSVGMPVYGHAFVTTQGFCGTAVTATDVVRDRKATAVATGDLGLAPISFPGAHAWRPPTC
ncbi:MAG: hypothetical protein ACXVWZ_03105 [Nocardioides sp.]